MDIGTKIKKYREKYNISQDELALKVFVSRQTISNWETNKSYPDIKSLTMLSSIFNVSLDLWLYRNSYLVIIFCNNFWNSSCY